MRLTTIAFVHDRLYYMAGAEQVFIDSIKDRLYQAGQTHEKLHFTVFTLFSNKYHLQIDNHTITIVTALPRRIFSLFVYFDTHRTPLLSKLFDYRNLIFRSPLLVWILRKKIQLIHPHETHISSFAVAKNIAPTRDSTHTNNINNKDNMGKIFLYTQSPFMYIHNHYTSNLLKLHFPIKQFYQLAHRYLLPRDMRPRRYDYITSNSFYTAKLISDIYGLLSTVSYPKLDPSYFAAPLYDTRSDYYVFIGRLVCFSKQVDIIIKTFNRLQKKLIIIGSGPDESYLRLLAGPTISFLGWMHDIGKKQEILGKACGLVNITLESFGYVTAESLCLGTPVIGYNQGATPELIYAHNNDDHRTTNGICIEHQSENALIEGIQLFEKISWEYEKIALQARRQYQ